MKSLTQTTRKSGNAYKFDGTFTRVSPANFAEKMILPLGWFVVRYDLIADKTARREAHGKWFAIKSDKETIYRMLRFSVKLTGPSKNKNAEMVLDWVGWIDLYDRVENVDPPLRLSVSRVPWWKLPWVYLQHPDSAVRLSSWLGWASILLGLLSIVLTVVIWRVSSNSDLAHVSLSQASTGPTRLLS
jgi:hypothetical protein